MRKSALVALAGLMQYRQVFPYSCSYIPACIFYNKLRSIVCLSNAVVYIAKTWSTNLLTLKNVCMWDYQALYKSLIKIIIFLKCCVNLIMVKISTISKMHRRYDVRLKMRTKGQPDLNAQVRSDRAVLVVRHLAAWRRLNMRTAFDNFGIWDKINCSILS